MKKSVLKQPAASGGKHVKTPQDSSGSTQDKHPAFCLKFAVDTHSVNSLDKDGKADAAERMQKLSKMSWAEINQAPRGGLGFEKIARNSIKLPIPKGITEDVNFLAFRYSGKKPMVGYRDEKVFYVVWFDHSFNVYDHGS